MVAAGNELRSGTFFKVLYRLVNRGVVTAFGKKDEKKYGLVGKPSEASKTAAPAP